MLWRDYQVTVAQLFRDLGLRAEVDVTVPGARARHDVDILVSFERWGVEHKWIVDCKRHRRSVPKRDVESLKSIAADVGAHHAFLVAESGFQPGALAAAQLTNVTLTTLEDLRRKAQNDIVRFALDHVQALAVELRERMHTFRDTTQTSDHSFVSKLKEGIDGSAEMRAVSAVSIILDGALRAKAHQFPVLVPDPDSPQGVSIVTDVDEFLEATASRLEMVKHWVETQERNCQHP